MTRAPNRRSNGLPRPDLLWVGAALVAGIAVFGQVLGHDFVDWDDPGYVLNNPRTLAGLTVQNLLWAAGAFELANWHPLTLASHMLDVELWGLWPGGHHLSSLVLHLANTVLLHLFLRRAGAEPWRAGLGALLFAVHPLHVESVAWISERKDVLSGFFWMLALLLYQGYARSPTVARYLAVIAAFALGLAAKPMLVTLPLLLVVLDYWPLRRMADGGIRALFPLLAEKLPLLAVSAVAAVLTLAAQSQAGAVHDFSALPFGERLANALVAYWRYLLHAAVPAGLHYLYERGPAAPLWQPVLAAAGLIAVTAAALRARHRQPAWIVGWLWFLGTLVPVIGLVQVGYHALADRYMYMPVVGLIIALCWSLPASGKARTLAVAATVIWVAALASQACALTASWRSSLDVYRRAVEVQPRHCRASNGYANQLINAGRFEEARERLDFVLANCPEPQLQASAYALLGKLEQHAGNTDQAISVFREAIARWPQDPAAHVRLGSLLMELGRYDDAVAPLRTGLAILGPDLHGRNMLVEALARSNRGIAALSEIRAWLGRSPEDPTLWFYYGLANERAGALDAAIGAYAESARRARGEVLPRLHLGAALAAAGRPAEARRELLEVLHIDPGNARARRLLQELPGTG